MKKVLIALTTSLSLLAAGAAVAARGAAGRNQGQRCQQGTTGEDLLTHVHKPPRSGSGLSAGCRRGSQTRIVTEC